MGRRRGRKVLTEDVTGSEDGGDEEEAKPEEKMSNLEYVDMGTGLAVWLWPSPVVHLRQTQLRVRSTWICGGTTLKNPTNAKS